MFKIAFQMFDFNGDGEVSPEEFEKVRNLVLNCKKLEHPWLGQTGALSIFF